MAICKHEFVYDELHRKIVCKFCGTELVTIDLNRRAGEEKENG